MKKYNIPGTLSTDKEFVEPLIYHPSGTVKRLRVFMVSENSFTFKGREAEDAEKVIELALNNNLVCAEVDYQGNSIRIFIKHIAFIEKSNNWDEI